MLIFRHSNWVTIYYATLLLYSKTKELLKTSRKPLIYSWIDFPTAEFILSIKRPVTYVWNKGNKKDTNIFTVYSNKGPVIVTI